MTKPVHKIRAGPVAVALWENDAVMNGRNVTMLKATVERRYKDASGSWKSSNSFGRNEIPLAVYCLQKAFEYMLEEQAEDEPAQEEAVQ